MSEISLRYLIDCYASDGEAWEIKHHSLFELMNARIARAEAAERVAEAVSRVIHGGLCAFTAWDAVRDYVSAREAVRKLEEGL